MKPALCVALTALVLTASCGGIRESRLNPFNWFGRSTATATSLIPEGRTVGITDNRPLVDQVLSLSVEQVPGGAVVRVVGLTATQGWWDAELVPENEGEPVDGVLGYQFRVAAPRNVTPISTPQSREVTAAAAIGTATLDQVRTIRVTGARNERSSGR